MSISMPPDDSQSSGSASPKSPLNLLSGGLFAAFLAATIAAPTMGGVTGPFWVHMMIVLIALFGSLIIWFQLIPRLRVRHKILSIIVLSIIAIAYDGLIIGSRNHGPAPNGNSQQDQSGSVGTSTSPNATEPSPRATPSPAASTSPGTSKKETAHRETNTSLLNGRDRSDEPVQRSATVADGVRAMLREQLQVDESRIKPQSDLILDLGATPLDVTEIVMQLETSYDIKITSSEARKLKSVQDLIDCVERKTAEPAASR